MSISNKTAHLQIRVTTTEKAAIQLAAQQSNMDMSSYVLDKVLPSRALQFQELLKKLIVSDDFRYLLSEINTLLSQLNGFELKTVATTNLPKGLSDYLSNYVAAMVETICNQQQIDKPEWAKQIAPLKTPVFGSTLLNLRLYLLTSSPAAFRRRNIFIDTTVGGQV